MNQPHSSEAKVTTHTFEELTTRELYEILKVRSAVFVVEQKCFYQDLDDIDFKAIHAIVWEGDTIVAYARVFRDGASDAWHIGRVLTTQRNKHFGVKVMQAAIEVAKAHGAKAIEIDAQCHAIGFYEKIGFQVNSDEFLIDRIPHKKMKLQ